MLNTSYAFCNISHAFQSCFRIKKICRFEDYRQLSLDLVSKPRHLHEKPSFYFFLRNNNYEMLGVMEVSWENMSFAR